MQTGAGDGQPFELTLLGGIDLRGARDADALLVQTKVVALLAYLCVPAVGRFVRRDALVGLLWPELDQPRARAALRKAIHAIRTVLGAQTLLTRGDEEIALSAQQLSCDAAAFTQAADAGFLMQALQLYSGELMPGFHLDGCWEFSRWLDEERSAARERAAAAAWALAQRFEKEDQLTDAASMARRAVKFSWSDERALRRALLMLDRLGDRASAARLYDEFERRLKSELDIAPSAETAALMATIRNAPRS